MTKEYPLTSEEFNDIYSKVPRVTVEVLVKGADGIYLTKRDIEPCKGQWHLPGGTVYYGEALLETVYRIAEREIKITVEKAKLVGVIEYPSHYKGGSDHPVGIVYEVTKYSGNITFNPEAQAAGWFTHIPENMHADQDTFLKDNEYLL